MAKMIKAQNYPRIEDINDDFDGFLDETKLQPHTYKIPKDTLRGIIKRAIVSANTKSSRAILNIPENTSNDIIDQTYI